MPFVGRNEHVAVDPVTVAGVVVPMPPSPVQVAGLIEGAVPKDALSTDASTLVQPDGSVHVKTAVCAIPSALNTVGSNGSTNAVPVGMTPVVEMRNTSAHESVNVVPLVTATTWTVTGAPLTMTVRAAPAVRPDVELTVTVAVAVDGLVSEQAGVEGAVLTYCTPTVPASLLALMDWA
jgi:hypothetical protein